MKLSYDDSTAWGRVRNEAIQHANKHLHGGARDAFDADIAELEAALAAFGTDGKAPLCGSDLPPHKFADCPANPKNRPASGTDGFNREKATRDVMTMIDLTYIKRDGPPGAALLSAVKQIVAYFGGIERRASGTEPPWEAIAHSLQNDVRDLQAKLSGTEPTREQAGRAVAKANGEDWDDLDGCDREYHQRMADAVLALFRAPSEAKNDD